MRPLALLAILAGALQTPAPSRMSLVESLAFINAQFVVLPISDDTDQVDLERISVSPDRQQLVFEYNQKLKVCCKDRGNVTFRFSAKASSLDSKPWAGENYITVACLHGDECVTTRKLYSDGRNEAGDPAASIVVGAFPRDSALLFRLSEAFTHLRGLLKNGS